MDAVITLFFCQCQKSVPSSIFCNASDALFSAILSVTLSLTAKTYIVPIWFLLHPCLPRYPHLPSSHKKTSQQSKHLKQFFYVRFIKSTVFCVIFCIFRYSFFLITGKIYLHIICHHIKIYHIACKSLYIR